MAIATTRFCDCNSDGFCPRYNRDMGGRMREICAGVNVDLGTSAAFREQWARESRPTPTNAITTPTATPQPLLLKNNQAPGDAVAMTAAIYSLHRAHPGKYVTIVESKWPDVFDYNPDVPAHIPPDPHHRTTVSGVSEVQMHYPAVHRSNERGIHFMQGWCEFLGMALGIQVPLLTNRPRIYFPGPQPPIENFWIICSGGKSDFTNKLWGWQRYQDVVGKLYGKIRFIQVGESVEDHPPLRGVESMVGKTTLRQLFDLVRRARGVLCGVSLLMHVAAALDKPAVVIAGGREPVQWNAYPKQQYLHTVGALPCRDTNGNVGGACWRYRVKPLRENPELNDCLCERPVRGIPECMTMICPEEVAAMVLRYNR